MDLNAGRGKKNNTQQFIVKEKLFNPHVLYGRTLLAKTNEQIRKSTMNLKISK